MQPRARQCIEAAHRAAAWIGTRIPTRRITERLRQIDAERDDRQTHAHADADRILQRIAEAIERTAGVEECRDTEIARQIADDLRRAREQMSAADLRATRIGRCEIVIAVAAHAAIAAGKETLGAGQIGRRGDFPSASALSLILMAVVSIAYLVCARWLRIERA